MDEVRISKVTRSAEWIKTEYNNQNDTASFLFIGSEEDAPSPTLETSDPVYYEWVELYNPSTSACNLNDLYLSDYEGNLFDLSGAGTLSAAGYLVAHLGEPGINSTTDVYGPVINYISPTKSMLADADALSVKSSQGYIFDFIAWGGDPNSDDYCAVDQNLWTDDEFIDTSEIDENETIGRDKNSRDLNNKADWENPSNMADPYGIHAAAVTPGSIKYDQRVVINEINFDPSGELYKEWANRKKITIDSDKVTSDLTNFPVLISVMDSDLTRRAQPDGDDIMFIASDETTKYNHEIEHFDSGTGELVAWVNITSVPSSTDTEFYIYYNNPGASDQSNTAGVWDNDFVGVWHLNEAGDGSLDEYKDNSQYGNHGRGGSGTPSEVPTRISTKIGYGQDFDGSDDHINCGDDTSLDLTGTQITLEGWIRWQDSVEDLRGPLSKSGWDDGYRLLVSKNTQRLSLQISGDTYNLQSTSLLSPDTWYYVVGIYNGANMNNYIDGSKDSNEMSKTDNIESTIKEFWIGHGDGETGQSWSYPWDGSLDEIRVSKVARSEGWINASFANQNSPDTFYTLGHEEIISDSWLYRKTITIDSSQVESDLSNFPVLISTTDLDVKSKARVDGYDIAFTASDGKTKYYHEIENYDSATGELTAWVNITSLSSSSDTNIYMYYGYFGNSDTYDQASPEDTWDSNYVGIWHLAELAGTHYDSTTNSFDGSTYGHISPGVQGKIDSACEFNGSYNNSINIPDDPALEPSSITVECWWSTDVLLPNNNDFLSAISKADDSWNDGYVMGLYRFDGDSFNGFMFFSDFDTWAPAQWDVSNIAVGSWYYAAGVYDGLTDVARLFINGSVVDIAPGSGNIVGTTFDLNFGTHDWEEWNGKLDEIRISNIVRSDAWLNTTFNTQHNTSTFISIGSEEPTGAQPQHEWVELYNAGDNAINVSGWYISDNDGNKFYITGAGEIPAGGYLVCHLAELGTNCTTDVYGPIISEDTVTSITMQPGPVNGKDTVVDISNPNENNGYDGWAEIMDWDTSTAVDNLLLQFDLSAFSPNSIVDANLWLYRYDGGSTYGANISACRLTQSWTEFGATWSTYDGTNTWAMGGGDFNPDIYDYEYVLPAIDGWYKWNITELVDQWKDGTYPDYGVILVGNDDADWQMLRPSDYAEGPSYRPKLTVYYTVSTPRQVFMLENSDDLMLCDNSGRIIDYAAWGDDAGSDDNNAVSWRQWTDGEYIDVSLFFRNQTIGRDANSNDVDMRIDWENATGYADPFGIHRSDINGPSPGARNVDTIYQGPTITGVSCDPGMQFLGGYVNISCTVMDSDGVYGVWINISLPTGGYINDSMTMGIGNQWYYNKTYSDLGLHQYTIWANDTIGNGTGLGIFQFQVLSREPFLSSEQVNPTTGNIDTWFNFTVTYTDMDNLAPEIITVNITGVGTYGLIEVDSLDTDYTDGKDYYHEMSGFGLGIYTFNFAANNTLGYWNESGILQFEIVNRDPMLSSNQVSPITGYIDTLFNFTVIYTDLDNHDPDIITVNITGVGTFNLIEVDSLDTDRTDGKDYYCEISGFGLGTYDFHFAANDTIGNWIESGNLQFDIINRNPSLSPGQVNPTSGNIDTWFNFTVTYTDLDNHDPDIITVNITGVGTFDLIEVDSLDTDHTDGKDYYYEMSGFGLGTYDLHFAANDTIGTWIETSTLQFDVVNRNPTLSPGQVDPISGDIDTWFNFTVTYTDLDNHDPDIITVNITGVGTFDLIEVNSLDTDHTDGKDYYYEVSSFGLGTYDFHFAANDTIGNWIESGNLQFVVANRNPTLSPGQVDPTSGNIDTWFNFTVTYTDLDNHDPDIITVNISGAGIYDLIEVDSSDTDYTDGKEYYYNTTLPTGSYSFHFASRDSFGLWAQDTPEISGLIVSPKYGNLEVTDTFVDFSDDIYLVATLLDDYNDPISGENVTFYIDINQNSIYEATELVGVGMTQGDGSTFIIYTTNLTTGTYDFTAVYTGSGNYTVADVEALLVIDQKQATLIAISVVVEEEETSTITAVLKDNDDDPVPDEQVAFYLDKNRNGVYEGSEFIVIGITSPSGVASINYYVNLIPGNYGIWAKYEGTTNYDVNEIEALLTVQSTGNNPPSIIGIVPNQIKPEDSLPWILDLTLFEDDIEDSGPDLKWYLTGVDTSLYTVTGLNSSDDVLTFIPKENAFGNDEVILWLKDSSGDVDSQILWVNITPVNDIPYFDPTPPDLYVHYDDPSTSEDTSTSWDYTFYVQDVETLKENLIISTSEPTVDSGEGYAEVSGLKVTFHYPQSRVGDSIWVTLTLSDGSDYTQTIILVNITSEWVPELISNLPDVVIEENTTIYNVFDLDDYFSDRDNDVLFFSSGYQHIKVDINDDHTVDITAIGQWIGSEFVTFRARDPIGAIVEDTIIVTVIPVNDEPVINGVPDLVVHYDYSYAFDLSPYISDSDNQTTELEVWTSESTDYIRIQQDNNLGIVITYPEPMNGMTIPVTIYVSDGIDTSSYQIQVSVTSDFPPELISNLPDVSFDEDASLTNAFCLSDYFIDVDSDILYYTNGTKFINITINDDLTVDFTAPKNWYGSEIVTFRATDPFGALAEDKILVVVVPVNDAPTISPIPRQEKREGDQWILDLSQYIFDVDNDASELIITVDGEFGEGYVTLVGNILVFQYPDGVYEDVITITVSDGELETSRSFVVSIKNPEPLAPSIWDMMPWAWIFTFFFVALGVAIVIYKKKSGYRVYEAFLIHEKGLPIAHASREQSSELEDVVVSGMFTAVQDFISDAFSGKTPDDDWELDEMKFGENKILIERSQYLFLAVIFEGNGNKLRNRVINLLADINKGYGAILKDWDGDMNELRGISLYTKGLIRKKGVKQPISEEIIVQPIYEVPMDDFDHITVGEEYVKDMPGPTIDIGKGAVSQEADEIIQELIGFSNLKQDESDDEPVKEVIEEYDCPVCGNGIKKFESKCTVCGTEFRQLKKISKELHGEVAACPSCGTEVGKNDAECPVCGAEFGDTQEGTLGFDCPACGRYVESTASICPNCGIEFIREND
ncbi:MAG: DUF2341 domain-containing protein [Methanomassiliicoccales archaeon]|nr:MAG: DUF2341 domain-containing protein [Methanomassiliicoccales archaeon]